MLILFLAKRTAVCRCKLNNLIAKEDIDVLQFKLIRSSITIQDGLKIIRSIAAVKSGIKSFLPMEFEKLLLVTYMYTYTLKNGRFEDISHDKTQSVLLHSNGGWASILGVDVGIWKVLIAHTNANVPNSHCKSSSKQYIYIYIFKQSSAEMAWPPASWASM